MAMVSTKEYVLRLREACGQASAKDACRAGRQFVTMKRKDAAPEDSANGVLLYLDGSSVEAGLRQSDCCHPKSDGIGIGMSMSCVWKK